MSDFNTGATAGKLSALKRWQKKTLWILSVPVAIMLFGYWIHEGLTVNKDYWPNGQLKSKIHLSVIGIFGKTPWGKEQHWYPDGRLEFEGNWDDEGHLEGPQTWYSEDSKVLDTWIYHFGVPDSGQRRSYWPNGTLHQQVTYDENGAWDGRVLRMSQNGSVLLDWTYSHGVPADGTRTIYYEDGKIESVFVIKNGKPSNVLQYWTDGTVVENISIDYLRKIAVEKGDTTGGTPRYHNHFVHVGDDFDRFLTRLGAMSGE